MLKKRNKSLTPYWDKNPFGKDGFVTKKNFIIFALICEIILFFFANYIVNVLMFSFSNILKSGFNFAFGIKFMFIKSKAPLVLLMVMLLLSFLNIKTWVKLYIKYNNDNNIGHKGTQRWTTPEEIREQYVGVPLKDEEYESDAGFPISRQGETIYCDTNPVNNCILGMTRSGKGETLVFPMIDIYSRSKKKPSMVVTDPKLELYIASKKTLEERGYTVYFINNSDPIKSSGYNPLSLILEFYKKKDYGTAEALCYTFAYTIFQSSGNSGDNKFFEDTATSLLCALIWAHMEDCIAADEKLNRKLQEEAEANGTEFVPTNENERKINLYSIYNLFVELTNAKVGKDKSALDSYFMDRPAGNKAKIFFSASNIAGDKTKGSIYATEFSKLDIFAREKNAKMLAENSINFVDVGFGDKPIAIFVGIPDIDKSNHFLATVFISQLYFAISKECENRGGKCLRKVHFILDEFGNLPKFDAIDSWVSVCLGRNIRFNLFLQSYGQLEEKYSKPIANIIMGNCGNQVYILSDDEPSCTSFSKLLGNKTVKVKTKSGEAFSTKVNISEHFEERPLLNYSELMNFTEGESCIVRAMTRKDLKYNSITSYPIYNTGENKAIPRYQYLLDSFPQGLCLDDVGYDDRSNINLRNRMFDTGTYIDELQHDNDFLDLTMQKIFEDDFNNDTALKQSDTLKKLDKKMSVSQDFSNVTMRQYLSSMRTLYTYGVLETKEYQSLRDEMIEMAEDYIDKQAHPERPRIPSKPKSSTEK